LFFNSIAVFTQNSGVWSTTVSGLTTTWSSIAGEINIIASATSYGSVVGFPLNNFVTYDKMGRNNTAYSDNSIVGNPSLSVRYTFANIAQITFNVSKVVENPVIHLDRLGG
jgi:hypothetical protein